MKAFTVKFKGKIWPCWCEATRKEVLLELKEHIFDGEPKIVPVNITEIRRKKRKRVDRRQLSFFDNK